MKTAIAAAVLLATMGAAHAQNTSSAGTGVAGASASNVFQAAPYPTRTRQRIENTPDPAAPAVFAGTNPCAVGISGGLSLAGVGVAAGATYSDKGCERRNLAGAMTSMGQHDAAREVLCFDQEARAAFLRTGNPCYDDLPAEQKQARLVMAASRVLPTPAQLAVRPPVAPAPAPTAQTSFIVDPADWCPMIRRTGPLADRAQTERHRAVCAPYWLS